MKPSNKEVINSLNIIAIDPGESGGIAFIAKGEAFAINLENEFATLGFIKGLNNKDTVCYMEQVQGYIGGEGAPGSAMFNFGNGYGYIRGLLAAFAIPCRLIPPQKWMRSVAPGVIGMEYNKRKRALRALAQSWYPDIDVSLKTADALCLLRYALNPNLAPQPVAMPARSDFARDAKHATKWCKLAGHEVPKRGSKDFLLMVNYFVHHIRR